jgi:protein TonB
MLPKTVDSVHRGLQSTTPRVRSNKMEMIKSSRLRWIGCLALLVSAEIGHAQTAVVRDWQKQIGIRLSGNKGINPQGQNGTAKVGFVIDRTGKLVSSWLAESTGIPALDEHALAIVERSQPFPMPPPELNDDQLRMTVPFTFDARPEPGRASDFGEAAVGAKMRSICRGC